MNTFPPYEITVYNRVTEIMIGSYHSNQVPARGDQISFFGHRIPGDPFELWGRWKVDEVVWLVSQAGSMNALELARTHNTHGQAACLRVEIHCWPAQGPFYENTPKWAKAASPPGYHDDDEPDVRAVVGSGRADGQEQA